MSKKIRAAWGIPFSVEQRELADRLIARLSESQITLLDAYFNGKEEAIAQMAALLKEGTESTGGSVSIAKDPIWGIEVLKRIAKEAKVEYNRTKPFYAPIIKRRALNTPDSSKETYHIELSLEGSGLSYEPGDSCGIYGNNPKKLVEDIISQSRFDENGFVELEKGFVSLREALTHHVEITNLTADVLRKYNQLAENEDLSALLADKQGLKAYLYGRDVLDLIKDYPAALTAQEFCEVLKKMRPRLYSIASSLSAHPEEVHLTVGAVRYSAHGREKEGTCSTYLADRIFETSRVALFMQKSPGFRLPADTNAPVIMIGAGTGIAPFRAFLEERAVKKHGGKSWLFFGNPHSDKDFLYQEELEAFQASGVLSELSLAFSRDQEEKIYVQHRIVEQSDKVYEWLQAGATIYVCGSRDRLSNSIKESFAKVYMKHEGLSETEAMDKVKGLKKTKQYHEDVY